jgi:hypothetical protein
MYKKNFGKIGETLTIFSCKTSFGNISKEMVRKVKLTIAGGTSFWKPEVGPWLLGMVLTPRLRERPGFLKWNELLASRR